MENTKEDKNIYVFDIYSTLKFLPIIVAVSYIINMVIYKENSYDVSKTQKVKISKNSKSTSKNTEDKNVITKITDKNIKLGNPVSKYTNKINNKTK